MYSTQRRFSFERIKMAKDKKQQQEPQEWPVAYGIEIATIGTRIRVAFVFKEPEHLKGVEAFHFTLSSSEADAFIAKIRAERTYLP